MTEPTRAEIVEKIIREYGLDQRRIRCPHCDGTGRLAATIDNTAKGGPHCQGTADQHHRVRLACGQ
jgi:hypothetical protein